MDLDRTVAHLSKLVMTLFDSQKQKTDSSSPPSKANIQADTKHNIEAPVNKPDKVNNKEHDLPNETSTPKGMMKEEKNTNADQKRTENIE